MAALQGVRAMFKEFVDKAGHHTMVQSELVFMLTETQAATATIIAPGGAAVATTIPYAEIRAWLQEIDAENERLMLAQMRGDQFGAQGVIDG
jgi:hypothetical protein